MKRNVVLLTALALVAGVLSASTVSAQEAPATTVPEVANIEDPFGDANTQSGDVVGPADASTVGDIGKVWYTNTPTTISVHFLTEAPPPASANGVQFRAFSSPDAEGTECLVMRGIVASGAFVGENIAKIFDVCNDGSNFFDNGQEGELAVEETADGTGITTLTFAREGYTQLLAAGAKLTAPRAQTDVVVGLGDAAFQSLRLDDTQVGTDYEISDGPSLDPGDPPKVDPPVKKGCKKGKGKKKGCKPKPPKCSTITPSEGAEEAETTVVTDKATEEAPVEIPITAEAGLPVASSHVFHNLQVDTKNKDAGLYVRYEFPTQEDNDLYLYNSDGSTAAQGAGFNPFPFIPNNPVFFTDGTGTGGHSEQGAEQVDGVLTPDCGGYTADLAQYLSEGGDFVVKVWLGKATWDPVAQAPIEDEG